MQLESKDREKETDAVRHCERAYPRDRQLQNSCIQYETDKRKHLSLSGGDVRSDADRAAKVMCASRWPDQFDPPRLLPKIRTRKNSDLATKAILKSGLFCLSGWFRPTKKPDRPDKPNKRSSYGGSTAITRNGPPVPPAIFIGRAMTSNPRCGRSRRSLRFSNTGTFWERSATCVSNLLDCP